MTEPKLVTHLILADGQRVHVYGSRDEVLNKIFHAPSRFVTLTWMTPSGPKEVTTNMDWIGHIGGEHPEGEMEPATKIVPVTGLPEAGLPDDADVVL